MRTNIWLAPIAWEVVNSYLPCGVTFHPGIRVNPVGSTDQYKSEINLRDLLALGSQTLSGSPWDMIMYNPVFDYMSLVPSHIWPSVVILFHG